MSKMFQIEQHYLEHDGGSKFYETVIITEKQDSGLLGPSILVQRWGKIVQNTNGGSTKVVKGNLNTARTARDKVLADKRRMKPGKGQYLDKTAPFFGFGRVVTARATNEITLEALAHTLAEHYTKTDESDILNYFGIATDDLNNPEVVEDDAVDDGLEELIRETERGTNWGSW